jgi:phenylacetate-CoA ligase
MYSGIYRTMRLFWPGGQETRRHLRELERTQWLSRPELEALQLRKIQQLVKYAYEHVPYYRERYQREDIHPDDIKSLKDFQALPFLTKEDVNNRLDALVSPEYRDQLQPESTGGSTGEPMRFFFEDSFWWWNAALEFRGRGWHRVREGDKMAWVWGAQRDMPGWSRAGRLKARIMRQRFLNAYTLTKASMQAFAEMIVRWQPAMFRAYPSALSLFAQFIKERGITDIRPRLIETTAEKVTELQRELFEEVFHCPVADCYSARELGTIAYQCEAGGLHVCETRHLEIVADGQVVPPGQLGEVVVTSLHQFAMPFIRYKNDDMGIHGADNCPCGRGLPVLREVVGRTADFLVTVDGQFVHGVFLASIFRVRPVVIRFQAYQPDKQHLEVRLVCKQDVDAAWLEEVRQELQARFGEGMQISLQVVDDIELTPAGKHRFIISEVKPDFSQPYP